MYFIPPPELPRIMSVCKRHFVFVLEKESLVIITSPGVPLGFDGIYLMTSGLECLLTNSSIFLTVQTGQISVMSEDPLQDVFFDPRPCYFSTLSQIIIYHQDTIELCPEPHIAGDLLSQSLILKLPRNPLILNAVEWMVWRVPAEVKVLTDLLHVPNKVVTLKLYQKTISVSEQQLHVGELPFKYLIKEPKYVKFRRFQNLKPRVNRLVQSHGRSC